MPELPGVRGRGIARQIDSGYRAGRRAVAGDFGSGSGFVALGQATKQSGEVALAITEVNEARKANEALVGFTRAVQEAEFEEQRNPDFAGREQRFTQRVDKLRGEYQQDLLPRFQRQLDQAFDTEASKSGMRVRLGAWNATVDASKASLDAMAVDYSRKAGQATPGPQRDFYTAQYAAAVTQAVEEFGTISRADGIARVVQFGEEVVRGSVLELIRTNPEAALDELEREDGRFPEFGAEERQVWIDRAQEAVSAELAREEQANLRALRLDAAQAKQKRQAMDSMALALMEEGRFDDLGTFFAANRDRMSTSARKAAYEALTTGSFGASQSNRMVLNHLSKLARQDWENLDEAYINGDLVPPNLASEDPEDRAGERVPDIIERAFLEGLITNPDRKLLLKASEAHRFGEAEKYLRQSFQADNPDQDGTLAVKFAEAWADFTEWRLDPGNHGATRQEAMSYARQLRRELLQVDEQTSAYLDFPIKGLKTDAEGRVDRKASLKALESLGLDEQSTAFHWQRIEREARMKGEVASE